MLCICHRSYAVAGPLHWPIVLSIAWWFSIFSFVFLWLFFRIFAIFFWIWTFLKCIGWKLFHLNWNCGYSAFCKVFFAKSYFVKQLWYKLFRLDRSCGILFRLDCVSGKWHLYEIMDSSKVLLLKIYPVYSSYSFGFYHWKWTSPKVF